MYINYAEQMKALIIFANFLLAQARACGVYIHEANVYICVPMLSLRWFAVVRARHTYSITNCGPKLRKAKLMQERITNELLCS